MNTSQKQEELVKNIMQSGLECAMGGDPFKTAEENKILLESKYEQTISQNRRKIKKLISQHLTTIEQEIEKEHSENIKGWVHVQNDSIENYCSGLQFAIGSIRNHIKELGE